MSSERPGPGEFLHRDGDRYKDLPQLVGPETAYDRLTEIQQRAITALMTEPTAAAAARNLGVHQFQIYRWLKDVDFDEAYRDARWTALRMAISYLADNSWKAVRLLQHLVDEGEEETTQLRAATALLDYAMRGSEIDDLTTRIAKLEAAANV